MFTECTINGIVYIHVDCATLKEKKMASQYLKGYKLTNPLPKHLALIKDNPRH